MEKATIWAEGNGHKTTTLVYTNDGNNANDTAKLNANNRLNVAAITHASDNSFEAHPTFQVIVEAQAESGAVNRYIINVYRKDSRAELDMSDKDEDIHQAWTTVGGVMFSQEVPEHGEHDRTYTFLVSSNDIREIEGKYYINADIYSIENALGVRAGEIQIFDGEKYGPEKYVGHTSKLNEDGTVAEEILVPVLDYTGPGDATHDADTSGTVRVKVTSEDGSAYMDYIFDLTIRDGNVLVEEIEISTISKVNFVDGMELAYTWDDETGEAKQVIYTYNDIEIKIKDAKEALAQATDPAEISKLNARIANYLSLIHI